MDTHDGELEYKILKHSAANPLEASDISIDQLDIIHDSGSFSQSTRCCENQGSETEHFEPFLHMHAFLLLMPIFST